MRKRKPKPSEKVPHGGRRCCRGAGAGVLRLLRAKAGSSLQRSGVALLPVPPLPTFGEPCHDVLARAAWAKTVSLRAVVDHVLDGKRARRCDTEESVVRISSDLKAPKRQLGRHISGVGSAIQGRLWPRSKMRAVSSCMPALTAQQQRVKILLDWEEDAAGGLGVAPQCPGKPALVTREQVVNFECNLTFVGER